jgi:hypothetical protein
MRTSIVILCSAAVLCHAGVSLAQQPDPATKAAARLLGEEGMKHFDKGECADAAEKLGRAHDLVHVPTLAFYAGKCLEKLGRLVEASERYADATRDTIESGAPQSQRKAQAEAEQARKALLPRLGSVEIVLKPFAPDAVVSLDNKQLPAAAIGVKRPVDPGEHEAVVFRAGMRVPRKFSVKEGEPIRLEIDVPAVPGYPYPMYPGVPYGYPPPYATPVPPAPRMKRQNLGLFVGGVILIPVASIGLITGGLLLLGNSSSERAGGATLVVSLLGLGGGIAMTVIGGKRVPDTDAPAVSFEPFVGPTSAGLRGRF